MLVRRWQKGKISCRRQCSFVTDSENASVEQDYIGINNVRIRTEEHETDCKRSAISKIDQLLMCIKTAPRCDQSAKEQWNNVKIESSPSNPSENSWLSSEENDVIAFGPIKVRPRKRPAPTLATGRRSKYEILTPEEEQKRNVRRARNRAAAERVRINRLTIEQELQEQIAALEQQEKNLSANVLELENQKILLETRIFTHERMCSDSNWSQLPQVILPDDFNFDLNNNQLISSSLIPERPVDFNIQDISFDEFFSGQTFNNEQSIDENFFLMDS